MPIKKAVFPVAGAGTRFLPATKANAKEMFPIVDKPLIQYAVEEAIRAGMTEMIIIISAAKQAIEDHFDRYFALETSLQQQGKYDLLQRVQKISPQGIQFTYVRQEKPLGLGHAVLCAEQAVANEPFAVILADDLIDDSQRPCLAAMANYFSMHQQAIIALQSVPWAEVQHYGIARVDNAMQDYCGLCELIEKPDSRSAPSNLAAIGRYIFTPSLFAALKQTPADCRGEIQLTDAIRLLLQQEKVGAWQFSGQRFDCGSKLGYMQAQLHFALRHEEIGGAFRQYLYDFAR